MSIPIPKLKRCPFCGGVARFGKGQRRKVDTIYERAGDWIYKPYIGCRLKNCGYRREFDSIETAVKWWNTRKGDKDQ